MNAQLKDFTVTDETKGEVSAVFATFGVPDRNGMIYEAGAFQEGAQVVISAYGNASASEGQLPVGTGVIRKSATEARFEGRFLMHIPRARDTFVTVARLGHLQEWSWTPMDVKSTRRTVNGRTATVVTSVFVKAVAPVLFGLDAGSRTIATKGRRRLSPSDLAQLDAIRTKLEIMEEQDRFLRGLDR